MIDFRLQTFIELCKQKNYTKTAQVLNITQPTVTGHIQYLEQQYEVKLFQYVGKKLVLTNQGEVLLNAALTMQSDCKKVAKRIKEVDVKKRLLRVGATLTIGEFVLPEAIKQYLKSDKETEFSLRISNTSHLLAEMKQGNIDCAFVEGYFNKRDFDYSLLMDDDFIGICGPNYKGDLHPRRLEETLENTLILREEGSGTREILERILYEKSLTAEDYQDKIEIGNLNVIKDMVKEDMGISFMYRSAVAKELATKELQEIKIGEWIASHEYNFVTMKNSLFVEEYQEFMEFIKSVYNSSNLE